ncbi:LCP family protein [Nonomuraea sp. NPDC050643]|uniref:LCP family protein n=1 Tax=Nonomuraea sp. NPDC050643 TaxID=3155660 RepID=UPI003400309F
MDDLRLLRDLGGELEHEPPLTLVRQRERLLRSRPRRRWTAWWTAGLVAAATAVAVAVPTVIIGGRNAAGPAAGGESVDVSGTRNVLVIGSDTRQGEGNAQYGPESARRNAGARSDTIIIVHMPADRAKATAVSVSRDTMVRIVSCGSRPARTDMVNAAYQDGGAACLRRTLEKLTGLTLHHTVEVDFAGFKDLVDAVGGVEVDLPEPVDDRASKLKLPAGKNVLGGEAALGYARLRRYGDGSDIARMKRQQQVVMALVKKSRGLAGDPGRLKSFLGEVSESVKTDLDLESMYELANQLSDTKLNFVAVPWVPYAEDNNRIQWKQPEAGRLFKALR